MGSEMCIRDRRITMESLMVSPGGPASQFLPLEHLPPFPYKVHISHVQEDIIYFIFQIRYWDKMGGPASQYPTELPPPHTRVNSL